MIKVNKKRTSLLLATIFSGLMSSSWAAENEEPEETARWFTVEVVVFKMTDQQGLFAESWDKKAKFIRTENAIDFLQPYQVEEVAANESSDALVDTPDAAPKQPTDNNPADAIGDEGEVSFVPLSDDQMQLNNEVTSLNRNPEYQVIFHQAWRQPVFDAPEAPSVRIAGGEDFSERFDYDGAKKTAPLEELDGQNNDPLATDNLANPEQNENPAETLANTNLTTSANAAVANTAIENGSLSATEQQTEQPLKIALPWVPELDGDIQIYLSHYLHIRTNLYLRRPDKEEVEVIDPNMLAEEQLLNIEKLPTSLLSQTPSTLFPPTSDNKLSPLVEHPATPQSGSQSFQLPTLPGANTTTNNSLITGNKSQFSWEIDDNFLETESEKMYIERLFDYPLKQSRRVRSGELHYFDHPLLGVLILITPYEPEETTSSSEGLLPPSI